MTAIIFILLFGVLFLVFGILMWKLVEAVKIIFEAEDKIYMATMKIFEEIRR